jgi:outer membrane receptor protein involved in Fe transport
MLPSSSRHFPQRSASRSALLSILLLLTLFLAAGTSAMYAQGITTGGISGTVVDPKGAVITSAQIKATNAATGEVYSQLSRGDGGFTLIPLPIGTYKVSISAPGFEELTVTDVSVTVGTVALGNEGVETVEASAVAPLLSTEQSQLSVSLQAEALSNLPFAGGFDTVALLSPGVAITHDNSFSNNNGAYGGFSSQGQRGRSNNFEIDGQSNNDNSVAGPQVFFSNPDALAEVVVITNNFSAQYGRNAGSVVNYLTKSGTNKFHGSAFEFYSGNWGESFAQGEKSPFLGFCAPSNPAPGCQEPTLSRFVSNIFGYTIGGPAWKDKLWFFSSGLWNRYRNGGGVSVSGPTSVTPDKTGLSQLQAAFPNDPGVAALVQNGPYSIATGNPHAIGTPVNLPVTDAAGTTATIEMASIGRSVPSLSNDEELLERADFQPTAKDHIFLRYFYQDDPFFNASGGASVYEGNWYNVPDTAHSVGADWSRTFSPSIVNQLRYSFQQTSVLFQSGGQPDCTTNTPDKCTTSLGIAGHITLDETPYSMISYGYATNIPQGRVVKVTQVQDNLTWTKGKQTILMGGEWDYQNSPNPFLPDYNGGFSFSSFGNFLSGKGSLTLGNGNGFTTKFTEPDGAAYFQDDWKVRPELTLNLGLRWEYFGQALNLLHDETVARETNASTAFWDMSLPLYVRTATSAPQHWKQFQPRIGLAWNPSFDKKLVVHTGFSINFDPAFYNMFLNSATAAPVVNLGSISGCGVNKQCLPSTGASGAEVRALDLPYIPVGPGVNPGSRNQTNTRSDFHNPYTESWLLGISHQLGSSTVLEVNYVGNHQVGNFQSVNANAYLPVVQAAFPSAVPVSLCSDNTKVGYGHLDCNLTNLRQRTNGAFAIYNSLQARLTTRAWHGLSTITNFTYSKTIDNTSEVYGTFAGGNTIAFAADPLNPNVPERGVSGDSEKFIGSSEFSYLMPNYHHGLGFIGRALSGYRMDTIWTFNTGQPVSPFQYGFFGDGGALQSYSDVNFSNWQLSGYDSVRPILNNASAPVTSVGVYDDGSVCGYANTYVNWATCAPGTSADFHWLRSTQLLAQQMGQAYPGAGRNSLRAFSWNDFDVSIQKQTRLTERVTMNLSVIMYDALNRQELGTPDTLVDDVGGSFMDYRYNYGGNGYPFGNGGTRNTQLKVQFTF